MLTIIVNGREVKVSIGCRTFVSLDVLLRILKVGPVEVRLNGETVLCAEFERSVVKGGDTLSFAPAG